MNMDAGRPAGCRGAAWLKEGSAQLEVGCPARGGRRLARRSHPDPRWPGSDAAPGSLALWVIHGPTCERAAAPPASYGKRFWRVLAPAPYGLAGRGRAGHSSIAAIPPSAKPQVQVERPEQSEDVRPGGAASDGHTRLRGKPRWSQNLFTIKLIGAAQWVQNSSASGAKLAPE